MREVFGSSGFPPRFMAFHDVQSFLSKYQDHIILMAGVSLAAFVVSIIVLPLILIRLPADYFIRPQQIPRNHPVVRILLKTLKNLIGLVLLILGFVMLFIPGQGILTMLFGVGLMDFPGKRALQTRIACAPRVHESLDWLRLKTNRPLFILPPSLK